MATGATQTTKADAASSAELIAANPDRTGLLITNTSSEILYIRLGSTAATTAAYTWKIAASGGQVDLNDISGRCWKGAVQGIWADNSTGAANITELA